MQIREYTFPATEHANRVPCCRLRERRRRLRGCSRRRRKRPSSWASRYVNAPLRSARMVDATGSKGEALGYG